MTDIQKQILLQLLRDKSTREVLNVFAAQQAEYWRAQEHSRAFTGARSVDSAVALSVEVHGYAQRASVYESLLRDLDAQVSAGPTG